MVNGDESLVKNASDEGQVRQAKRKERTERDKELDDLRFVLGSPNGRRLFWRLLSRCGVFRLSYTDKIAETNFNEGERNIGLFVLSEIMEAKPQRWVQMQQELGQSLFSKEKK